MRQPFPWHWGNSIYLEWYSTTNGRVVIEAAHYQLELDAEPAWSFTEEDEISQQSTPAEAMADFMEPIGASVHSSAVKDEDDRPQSQEEAQADAEDEEMQILVDRITARLERGEIDIIEFHGICAEERWRLMRERGGKAPGSEPDEEEERWERIEEMNEIDELAFIDLEAEKWRGENQFEEERHPLVEECCKHVTSTL